MKKVFKYIKKHWVISLAIVFFIGFVIYKQLIPAKTEGESSYKVKKQNLKESLTFSGEINAEEKVILRFQTSGRLSWVGVKEGDFVKKYQTIASLDQREVKKRLERTFQDYLLERTDFDQDLSDYKVITNDSVKRILEKSQYGLNKAVLDVEIQNLTVEFSNLFTPIQGVVTKVGSPYAGVNVTPLQAEIEVINPQSIYFSAIIDQTELPGLEEDKDGFITLDPYPDEKIKTKITSISFTPIAGESGTVYEAKLLLDVDNTKYKYRIGMTGDAEFVLREIENIIAVPSEFIRREGSRKYVEIKVNNNRKKTYVTTGEVIDDFTQIKSGLKESDVIYD
ncbi:MAG: efflux RND transporter periplasmic adaptor subunit [Nanoarchaeota archaeon]